MEAVTGTKEDGRERACGKRPEDTVRKTSRP